MLIWIFWIYIIDFVILNEFILNIFVGFIKFKYSLYCICINNYLLSNFKYGLGIIFFFLFLGCIENLKSIKKIIIY